MLRQIEWRLQNGLITKSGVLPVTTLFFWKFVSVLELLKRVNLMYQDPNVDIRISRKHWRLILRFFFPVSILNSNFLENKNLFQETEETFFS